MWELRGKDDTHLTSQLLWPPGRGGHDIWYSDSRDTLDLVPVFRFHRLKPCIIFTIQSRVPPANSNATSKNQQLGRGARVEERRREAAGSCGYVHNSAGAAPAGISNAANSTTAASAPITSRAGACISQGIK